MSQINKKYLEILKEIDKEHQGLGDLHRNSKTLVIDGLNTFIRSWSTAPNLNDNGDHIGGIVGTLKSIGYAIRLINPTRVVVVFDGKNGSKSRKDVYSGYKSERGKNKIKMRLNRAASVEMNPEEEDVSMKRQMNALGELLSVLPVTIMIYDGIEADDTMAYIATTLRKDNEKVIIMSSDKDFLQLVNKDVSAYSPSKKKIYTVDEVKNEYGFHPHNFINFRMIDGDKSDNVGGITGLGAKTIIKAFPILTEANTHTTETMLDYIETLPKKSKAHELFKNNLEILERNRKLMQLSEPDFSGNLRLKIMDRFDEPIPKFDKHSFLKLGLKHRMLDAFPNINEWLQSTFGHISKFVENK
jgi:DNA polymerase-1